ncbi:MAG: DUF4129 domain-containing protein [Sulfolobales archaeon]
MKSLVYSYKHVQAVYKYLLLVILLISLHSIRFSQAQDIYDERHTIGFPSNITSSSYLKILPTNLTEFLDQLKELQNLAGSCSSIECIKENYRGNLTSIINNLKRAEVAPEDLYPGIELLISSRNDSNLYSYIENLDLINLLKMLNETDPDTFIRLFETASSTINNMYSTGRISSREYVAALEILKRLSQEKGAYEVYNEVNKLEMKIFADFINQSLAKIISNTIGFTTYGGGGSSVNSSTEEVLRTLPYILSDLRNTQIIIPSLPLIPLSWLIPLIFLASFVILIPVLDFLGVNPLAFLKSRFSNSRFPDLDSLSRKSLPVRLYWMAVEILSRKIPKQDSETHREYLEKFKRDNYYKEIITPLENLTKAYELSRYAGLSEASLEEEARKSFNELKRFERRL